MVAGWNPFLFEKHRIHILHFPTSTGLFTKPNGCHYTKYWFSPNIDWSLWGPCEETLNCATWTWPWRCLSWSCRPLFAWMQGAPEAFSTWEMRGVWHVPHVVGASKWGFHFPTCDNFSYAGQFCIYMLEKFSHVLCIVSARDYEFMIFKRVLALGHQRQLIQRYV